MKSFLNKITRIKEKIFGKEKRYEKNLLCFIPILGGIFLFGSISAWAQPQNPEVSPQRLLMNIQKKEFLKGQGEKGIIASDQVVIQEIQEHPHLNDTLSFYLPPQSRDPQSPQNKFQTALYTSTTKFELRNVVSIAFHDKDSLPLIKSFLSDHPEYHLALDYQKLAMGDAEGGPPTWPAAVDPEGVWLFNPKAPKGGQERLINIRELEKKLRRDHGLSNSKFKRAMSKAFFWRRYRKDNSLGQQNFPHQHNPTQEEGGPSTLHHSTRIIGKEKSENNSGSSRVHSSQSAGKY